MNEKNGDFQTHYQSTDAGTLAFDRNEAVEEEVLACLEIVRQIRKDYKGVAAVQSGLAGVETELQNLRVSTAPEEQIREQLQALMKVPLTDDKSLRLDTFRKSGTKATVHSEEEYIEHVNKMVRNTANNTALLLLTYPNDSVLEALLKELGQIDFSSYKALRLNMGNLSESPQLWHYNEKKKAFLVEWLTPFQQDLDKPIERMTEEEFQAALKKVEKLRDQKLEEMTHLMVDSDREPFRPYNRAMSPVINGRDDTFWGGTETRDEFIGLMNKLISRFSFSLEDRYLIFRTKDGGFSYLIGFADEAFDMAITTADGKLGLYPHVKVFVDSGEGEYKELTLESSSSNSKVYYNSLKTAVVPFLRAAAVMVETELSDELKGAFDMWL